MNDSIATLELGLRHLRAEIVKIAAGKAKKTKHDPASRISYLSSGVGRIVDSLRKIEAARAKQLEAITPALVLAWFRQLDRTDREHIVRELSVIESRRSGLA